MKCQKCDRSATIHITELIGGIQEMHLCEEHAREYLTHEGGGAASGSGAGGFLAQQLQVTNTAEELAKLDQQTCPMCGISFFEFRNHGRFGCPHDYTCFESELEPLLMNIHGDVQHSGKSPKAGPKNAAAKTELIRLRREMHDAVEQEDYERASRLRDDIKKMETR
jgi:protein arginine kinase activator